MMKYIALCETDKSRGKFPLVKFFSHKFGYKAVFKEVVEVIEYGKVSKTTDKDVKKLEAQLIESLVDRGATADHVVLWLDLPETNLHGLLFQTKMELLSRFISAYNTENNAHVDMLEALISGLCGEDKLDVIFISVAYSPIWNTIASAIQTQLLNEWKGLVCSQKKFFFGSRRLEQ